VNKGRPEQTGSTERDDVKLLSYENKRERGAGVLQSEVDVDSKRETVTTGVGSDPKHSRQWWVPIPSSLTVVGSDPKLSNSSGFRSQALHNTTQTTKCVLSTIPTVPVTFRLFQMNSKVGSQGYQSQKKRFQAKMNSKRHLVRTPRYLNSQVFPPTSRGVIP
jgi:hypothetical protein